MRTLVTVAGTLVFATVGCAGEQSASRTAFSDSAGVRIALTDLRTSPLSPACRIDSVPRLQIGVLDGPREYQLGYVVDVVRTRGGLIIVGDRGNREIRVFDATGKFVRTIGRTGDGPGEFRDLIQLAVLGGDSLLVWDPVRVRAIVFNVEGDVLRESLFLPPMLNPPERLGIVHGRARFVAESWLFQPPNGSATRPQRLMLLRYDSVGQLVDTIDVLPHGELVITGGPEHRIGRPLLQWGARTAAGNGNMFLTRGNESSVEVRDSSWKLTRIIRWDEGDRRVTATLLAAARDAQLQGVSDPAQRASIAEKYASTASSDRIPAVDALKVDSQGRLWVRRYRRPNDLRSVWWSFGTDGGFICSLALPTDFRVTEFGNDYVLGVGTEDAGFEVVRMFGMGTDR